MSDTAITIIAIFLAAILMFIFPLMSMSERTDNVSQLAVQTSTTEFVNNVRTTGVLSLANYDKFVQEISATGNSYDVEMEVQVLDENPGKKSTQTETTKIGENVYYTLYTTQILDALRGSNNPNRAIEEDAVYKLKEGDMFSVSVKNTNMTISQQLRNAFYKIAGNDTYQIAAQHAGIVTVNGGTGNN